MFSRRKTTETSPVAHGSTAAPRRGGAARSGGSHAAVPDAPPASTADVAAAAGSAAQRRRDRAQGKGAPTPRRRDQVAARRRPLVPEDREAAKRAQKEAAAADRLRQREALETGDERHLPARDKGPQKRFVRDLVDARFSVGELLMPVVLVYIVLMFIQDPTVQLVLMITLYVLVLAVAVDSVLLGRRIGREVTARFGTPEPGIRMYGVMRALQFRRLRLPKPQVARGQHPA